MVDPKINFNAWLIKAKSQRNSSIELSFLIDFLFSKHLYHTHLHTHTHTHTYTHTHTHTHTHTQCPVNSP